MSNRKVTPPGLADLIGLKLGGLAVTGSAVYRFLSGDDPTAFWVLWLGLGLGALGGRELFALIAHRVGGK